MNGYARAVQASPKRERLIREHAGMAKRIAHRMVRGAPRWISSDDLVASAMLGLTEAADRYDDTRGEPFVAFAERRIRGAVLDELRRGDILPRRARITAKRMTATIRQLERDLGRAPEDDEIAEALGVSVETYHSELQVLTHVSLVELDDTMTERKLKEQGESPLAHAERRQLLAKVSAGLAKLAERDAQLLSLYYVEELTFAEIGEVLGVSESRVCQLHSRAILRLRAAIPGDEEG